MAEGRLPRSQRPHQVGWAEPDQTLDTSKPDPAWRIVHVSGPDGSWGKVVGRECVRFFALGKGLHFAFGENVPIDHTIQCGLCHKDIPDCLGGRVAGEVRKDQRQPT